MAMLERVSQPVPAVAAEPRGKILPLECTGISLKRGARGLLDDITLHLGDAPVTALLGPNGAGKTLLLRVLANLLTPDRGRVTWAGRAPGADRAPMLGFVFQKPVMLRRSVAANLHYVLAAARVPRGERKTRATTALAWASLDHLATTPARLLSGGEQQRLAVARVVACGPEIMLLDEPTSDLDLASTATIENMVREVAGRGTRIVFVTHDIAQARRLAHEVVFMHAGRVVETGPAESFFAAPTSPEARDYLAGRLIL